MRNAIPRAGLKGGGPGAIFTGGPLWRISWLHRLENLFFVDSQRSRLLFPVVGYVPAVLTPLLAAIDYYKPHEMVLKINVSRTWLLTALEHRLPKPLRQARNQLGTPGGAESFPRGSQIFWTMSNIFKLCRTHFSRGGEQISRVFFLPLRPPWLRACSEMHSRRPRTRAFPVLMMLTSLQLPSVYHNPSRDGCARDAEENRMRKKNLVNKTQPRQDWASSIPFDKVKK